MRGGGQEFNSKCGEESELSTWTCYLLKNYNNNNNNN